MMPLVCWPIRRAVSAAAARPRVAPVVLRPRGIRRAAAGKALAAKVALGGTMLACVAAPLSALLLPDDEPIAAVPAGPFAAGGLLPLLGDAPLVTLAQPPTMAVAVPEPGTAALLVVGVAGLVISRRRR